MSLILKYNILEPPFNLELPIIGGTFTVTWAPGVTDSLTSHNYTVAGEYTVTISGSGITSFDYSSGTGQNYLIECINFGNVGLTNMTGMFRNCNNLTSVPSTLPTGVTNLSNMFICFTFPLSIFNSSNVSNWDVSSVTNLSNMFYLSNAFNQDLSLWDVSNVTNMQGMFERATNFNKDISLWNVSNVTNMEGLFKNARSFNQNISLWNVSRVTAMFNMLTGSGLSITNYNNLLYSWAYQTVSSSIQLGSLGLIYTSTGQMGRNILTGSPYNWVITGDAFQQPNTVRQNVSFSLIYNNNNDLVVGHTYQLWLNYNTIPFSSVITFDGSDNSLNFTNLISNTIGVITLLLYDNTDNNRLTSISIDVLDPPPPIVCFKECSKILTDTGYKPIETLRKGDLVKTFKHGFKPIDMIGKKIIYNPSEKDRIKDQLYQCSQDKYPEIFEPLVITGSHSILIDNIVTHKQIEQIKEVAGNTYFTDDKLRLPACVDERASIYEFKGDFTIYHIALENTDYYMNYGIYANGLLVETCSKRYLKELSNMELIE